MNILKFIVIFLLSLLPIAVLYRDWKFHDKRTKKHHCITRLIIAVWFIGSIVPAIFVWVDSAKIEELLTGKDILITQNKELSEKLDKYQKDLNEKEKKINELEEKAQNAARGITSNYHYNGSSRKTNDGRISVDKSLISSFEQIVTLEKKKDFIALEDICNKLIKEHPEWATPYAFLGVAKYNLNKISESKKSYKYFLEISANKSGYGFEELRAEINRLLEKIEN